MCGKEGENKHQLPGMVAGVLLLLSLLPSLHDLWSGRNREVFSAAVKPRNCTGFKGSRGFTPAGDKT